ncbi:hypothetical protein EVAR_27269_1 [Eumeta japonica]|uniref:Uncharacterized protein n=1 Tax=Eumeta variegata TaxID=151549 RepID=A0A4C1W182_EUMVA|nr:hypothetical protein EVAR_27269_1 [Eumeta japonica]
MCLDETNPEREAFKRSGVILHRKYGPNIKLNPWTSVVPSPGEPRIKCCQFRLLFINLWKWEVYSRDYRVLARAHRATYVLCGRASRPDGSATSPRGAGGRAAGALLSERRCSISVNPLESIFNNLDRDSSWRDRFEETDSTLPAEEKKEIYEEEIPCILKSEVIKAIQSQKSGKAPGDDKISNEILKQSSTEICRFVTSLFNEILVTEQTPTQWTKSTITLLHKKVAGRIKAGGAFVAADDRNAAGRGGRSGRRGPAAAKSFRWSYLFNVEYGMLVIRIDLIYQDEQFYRRPNVHASHQTVDVCVRCRFPVNKISDGGRSELLKEGCGVMAGSRLPELSLTGRNTTAETVNSNLYSVRVWYCIRRIYVLQSD